MGKHALGRVYVHEILLDGKNISIDCYNMETSILKEYLSLLSGVEENYSGVYGKRLITPDACPHNGLKLGDCDESDL